MGQLDLRNPSTLGLYHIKSSTEHERLAPLSTTEYQRFAAASAALAGFSHWTESIAMVRANENEWLAHLQEAEKDASVFDITPEAVSRIFFQANRRLLNLLAAGNMFLDYTAAYLSRKYGDSSSELARFRAADSHAYDSVFAYRFLKRLRNYTLHCGLPVGSIDPKARQILADPTTHRKKGVALWISRAARSIEGWSIPGKF
jgi:hypothetical protein